MSDRGVAVPGDADVATGRWRRTSVPVVRGTPVRHRGRRSYRPHGPGPPTQVAAPARLAPAWSSSTDVIAARTSPGPTSRQVGPRPASASATSRRGLRGPGEAGVGVGPAEGDERVARPREAAVHGGDDQVAVGRDRGDPEAGREGALGQRPEVGRALGQLGRRGRRPVEPTVGGPGEHRPPGPARRGGAEGGVGGGQVGPVVGRPQGDEVLDRGRAWRPREGGPGHHAALRVRYHVDRHARVGPADVLEQDPQPVARPLELATGVGPPVVGHWHAAQVADPRRPPAAVRELDDVGGVVAQGGGVQLEHRGVAAARPVATDEDHDASLPRRSGDGLVRGRAPLLVGPEPAGLLEQDGGPDHGEAPEVGLHLGPREPGRPIGHGQGELPLRRRHVGGPRHCPSPGVHRPARGRPRHTRDPAGREAGEEPGPLLRRRPGRPQVGGHEVHLGRPVRPEEAEGVDVLVPHPGPPVQRGARPTDHVAARHPVAPADEDLRQERVAGAQPVGVEHHDVEPEAHPPGEGDLAVGGRPHGLADLGGVVHPAVAGAVAGGRRAEPVDQRAVDRRDVGAGLGGGGCGERPEQGDDGDEGGDGGRQGPAGAGGAAVPQVRGHGCSPRTSGCRGKRGRTRGIRWQRW